MKKTNKFTKDNLLNILSNSKSHISDSANHKKAVDYIEKNNLPDSKNEIWKHTKLEKIFKHNYSTPNKKNISEELIAEFSIHKLNANNIVFINGYYSVNNSIISDNQEMVVSSLQYAKDKYPDIFNKYFESTNIYKDNIFAACNTAFVENGAFIYIKDNHKAKNTVHIINFLDGKNAKTITQSRNLIVCGKNSKIKIINTYHSLSSNYTFNNVACEIILNENSQLNYNLFQGEGGEAMQINNTKVIQNNGSRFISNLALLCGNMVKNNLKVDISGSECTTELNGLYMPDREQYFDNYLSVNHLKPNSKSYQLFKGIVDNRAEVVFLGKVYVRKNASKTEANQSNNNILLTEYAKIHSKPWLEIYNDDVSCSHGSTTGQIDGEAIFYMQSRGISEKKAKALLMRAFAKEVLNKITIEPYREFINFLVNKRLRGEEVTGLCSLKICPSC